MNVTQPELVGGSYEEEQKVGGLHARIGTVATSPRVACLQHHNLQYSMSLQQSLCKILAHEVLSY